jgi:hypothetical protein
MNPCSWKRQVGFEASFDTTSMYRIATAAPDTRQARPPCLLIPTWNPILGDERGPRKAQCPIGAASWLAVIPNSQDQWGREIYALSMHEIGKQWKQIGR